MTDAVPPMRVDGERFCADALDALDRRPPGVGPATVVFDVDNTLVDTRPRTVAAARAFVDAGHTALTDDEHRALATLERIDALWDGRRTALALGLSPAAASAFHAFWLRWFWSPDHFPLDLVIPNTAQWLRDAAALGARVVYLTGRIESLAGTTRAQLRQHDLPFADPEHVCCKPSLAVRTAPFKRDVLRTLAAETELLWFMSDTHSDVRVAQDLALPGISVDFPARPDGEPELLPATPTLVAEVPRAS